MTRNAKARFDLEYGTVRKLVLEGKMPLQAAKDWIRRNGQATASAMQQELDRFHNICWASNPDMDVIEMQKERDEAKKSGEGYEDE